MYGGRWKVAPGPWSYYHEVYPGSTNTVIQLGSGTFSTRDCRGPRACLEASSTLGEFTEVLTVLTPFLAIRSPVHYDEASKRHGGDHKEAKQHPVFSGSSSDMFNSITFTVGWGIGGSLRGSTATVAYGFFYTSHQKGRLIDSREVLGCVGRYHVPMVPGAWHLGVRNVPGVLFRSDDYWVHGPYATWVMNKSCHPYAYTA